jgi:DNA-directed RNA polymerase subunit E'/Rpb7
MSYKNKQILQTNLNIESKDLNKDINNVIISKLKEKYEGLCSENGYILHDSIELINRKLGTINTINNVSNISYIVNYSADIIYPSEGDIIEITVDRINKMGVLGYIEIDTKDFENSPLIVIIPNEYFTEKTRDINSITVKQKLNVEIIGCRIKYGAKKIQIIATPK